MNGPGRGRVTARPRVLTFVKRFVPGFLAFVLLAAPALPCSFVSIPHEVDERERELDHSPPPSPDAALVDLRRGKGPTVGEDGSVSVSSCDDLGWISLRVEVARDDRTPDDELGYLVRHVDGDLPEGMRLSENAVRHPSGQLVLHWIDGASDQQEPIDFAVSVVVVDLAGNESEPSEPVRIRHQGTG